jgi:hypothetical protein
MIPKDAPIDRIVENLKARIAEHPEDAEAYYALGRAHALVYEYKNHNVLVWAVGEDRLEKPAPDGWQKRKAGERAGAPPTAEELRAHLTQAITNLNVAIEKDPAQARYHLALASALETGEALAGQVDVYPRVPAAEVAEAAHSYKNLIARLGTDPEALTGARRVMRGYAWDREGPSPRDQVVALLHQALADADPQRAALAKQLLVEDWREQIAEGYFLAMCLALPVNGKAAEKPLWGSMEDWVAYEGASDYVRVVESREVRDDERIRLSVAKATVRAFDSLPRPRAITPIVVRLERSGTLSSWIDPGLTSTFDLDGTGRATRWQWVKPDTALLVWDPARSGNITSGRQLFGSVTWWLLFRNGYEALDALDNNRDGWLAGAELRGLSLWFDRDSDGVSDAGEVQPVESYAVERLSTKATGLDGTSPMSAEGVRFADGRVLPTYDWVADSVGHEGEGGSEDAPSGLAGRTQ